jgi:hypothetical protein
MFYKEQIMFLENDELCGFILIEVVVSYDLLFDKNLGD